MTLERRIALMKPLTTREIDVLQNLADGLGTANKETN
jgi:DNA-binding NarL/FixJ family response regulator